MFRFITLSSGSSGNCVLCSDGDTNVLIDCGINGKNCESHLNELGLSGSDIDAICVTHEHTDHISGIGVMSRRFDIPVYANEDTWLCMEEKTGAIKEKNRKILRPDCDFEIKTLGGYCFSTPHDAAHSMGYSFFADKTKLSVATDIGHIEESIVKNLSGSHMVVLEANHDVAMLEAGPYPVFLKNRILGEYGHLSNETSASLATMLAESGTEAILLAHLSNENNTPKKAYDAVLKGLMELDSDIRRKLKLGVAKRYENTGINGDAVL